MITLVLHTYVDLCLCHGLYRNSKSKYGRYFKQLRHGLTTQ